MKDTKNILVVEDEVRIVEVVKAYLVKEGFKIYTAQDGEEALIIFKGEAIHLIILDLMLPKELSNSINYLAETLEKQEMLRKRLTSDMAHEIRTPLTTLKTHMEALIDGIWEPTRERFEVFYDELERLTKLVDNLGNIAKLEQQNDLHMNNTKFNLSQ